MFRTAEACCAALAWLETPDLRDVKTLLDQLEGTARRRH